LEPTEDHQAWSAVGSDSVQNRTDNFMGWHHGGGHPRHLAASVSKSTTCHKFRHTATSASATTRRPNSSLDLARHPSAATAAAASANTFACTAARVTPAATPSATATLSSSLSILFHNLSAIRLIRLRCPSASAVHPPASSASSASAAAT
jgi:hypothetical protein